MWIVGLNVALNMILIRGWGPIPGFGAMGAALGTAIASTIASGAGIWLMATGRVVVNFHGVPRRPDWTIIRALFRFGLPAGVQGVAMNVAGVLLLRFMGSLPYSAEAQAAYAGIGKYCAGCHSEKGKAGGLSLVNFDPAHVDQQAEVGENGLTHGVITPRTASRR